MRRKSAFLVALALVESLYGSGHGPVFGLATPTNPKGGWSLDMSLMGRAGKINTGSMARLELGYGITEDFKISFSAPAVFNAEQLSPSRVAAFTPMGSDFELLGTWRILRVNTGVGSRAETAVVGGLVLPGPQDSAGVLKNVEAGPSGIIGIVSGIVSRSHYAWAGATYQAYSDKMGDARRPSLLSYSAVYAYRPPSWRTNSGWDWRIFGELTGENAGSVTKVGITLPGSAVSRVFLGPSTLGVYKNYAVSAGIQIPVYQSTSPVYPSERFRFALNFAYFF